MILTHDQLINRINFEGKKAKDDFGKLRLHRTLTEVEHHLTTTFDEDPRPEPDTWIDLHARYVAARKWLDTT